MGSLLVMVCGMCLVMMMLLAYAFSTAVLIRRRTHSSGVRSRSAVMTTYQHSSLRGSQPTMRWSRPHIVVWQNECGVSERFVLTVCTGCTWRAIPDDDWRALFDYLMVLLMRK